MWNKAKLYCCENGLDMTVIMDIRAQVDVSTRTMELTQQKDIRIRHLQPQCMLGEPFLGSLDWCTMDFTPLSMIDRDHLNDMNIHKKDVII